MKKVLFIFLLAIVIVGCKKTKFSPEGPTDIRVFNESDQTWTQVIVSTAKENDTVNNIHTFGTIPARDTSKYIRFAKAYVPLAEITATIDGEKYSTGPVNYSYLPYVGQDKITYWVYIKNAASKLLEISNFVRDAPIDSL